MPAGSSLTTAQQITMNTAQRLHTGPRPVAPAAPPADPFPDRITAGSPRAAAALRAHHAAARAQLDRQRAEAERHPDDERGRVAAHRYQSAAREARAFARLAELHETQQMPSPLFTVRTRRHVRTMLAAGDFTPATEKALATALRWTLGLPMRRRTGYGVMRDGFERLGLFAPVVLPLAVAQALGTADASPTQSVAAPTAGVPVEAVPQEPSPSTVEAYVETATTRAAQGWIGHVTQFSGIDFAQAFEAGLSVRAAVQAARDWIMGAVAFGAFPFAWGTEDGVGRPFRRDERGRLRPAGDRR